MVPDRGRWLVGLLLTALLVFAAGCGRAASDVTKAEEPVTPPALPAAEPGLTLDSWVNPRDLRELVAAFAGLNYVWGVIEDGAETDQFEVAYRFLGEEAVEGRNTSKVSFSIAQGDARHELLLWLDPEGNAVRFELDGVQQDPMMAQHFHFWFLGPFLWVDQYEVHTILTTGRPGYDMQIGGGERVSFGKATAEVRTVKASWSEAGQRVGYKWSIGDFGELQMLVSWQMDLDVGAQAGGIFLRITEVETR